VQCTCACIYDWVFENHVNTLISLQMKKQKQKQKNKKIERGEQEKEDF